EGRPDLARAALERVLREQRGGPWELPATKALAALDPGAHRYAEALAGYERLAGDRSAFWAEVGQQAAARARAARARHWLFVAAVAALALLAALRAVRARRALWPVPEEVVYAMPAAALLAVAALGQPAEEARAVAVVALGGVALLW